MPFDLISYLCSYTEHGFPVDEECDQPSPTHSVLASDDSFLNDGSIDSDDSYDSDMDECSSDVTIESYPITSSSDTDCDSKDSKPTTFIFKAIIGETSVNFSTMPPQNTPKN